MEETKTPIFFILVKKIVYTQENSQFGYTVSMTLLCPPLFLAPMEGVGDAAFRKAMTSVGGFDSACTEFIRVPKNAHVASLATVYTSDLTAPIPQAAQIMGGDPELVALMGIELEKRGAPRIDLNCGCPSNTVTGRGAGSSLLKDPNHLYAVTCALVKAVNIPVSAKLRSGFSDTTLFKENLLAAQSGGIAFLTLHPRTKEDGYRVPAKWQLIAEAKALLTIPVIGNGDILTVDDALEMLKITKCDGIMIGRGAVTNPLIFHEIKNHFSKMMLPDPYSLIETFFSTFVDHFPSDMSQKVKINKLKQILSFLFQKNPALALERSAMLTTSYLNHLAVLERNLPIIKKHFFTNE